MNGGRSQGQGSAGVAQFSHGVVAPTSLTLLTINSLPPIPTGNCRTNTEHIFLAYILVPVLRMCSQLRNTERAPEGQAEPKYDGNVTPSLQAQYND